MEDGLTMVGSSAIELFTSDTCAFTEAASCLPCSISLSIVFFRSSEAFLNSARPLPSDLPISGSFLGPKTRRATTKIRINSGIPMEPSMFFPPRRRFYAPLPKSAETLDERRARMLSLGGSP